MGSASYSDFQVPNTPGLQNDPANYSTPDGSTTWNARADSGLPATFDSSTLNENQNEQNYYGVVTYQKSAGDLNFQASVFGRNSDVHFTPDPVGDLFFNGVASDVQPAIVLRRIAGRRQLQSWRQTHDSRRRVVTGRICFR